MKSNKEILRAMARDMTNDQLTQVVDKMRSNGVDYSVNFIACSILAVFLGETYKRGI